jgi:cellulose synthase/poly-beta-1,6-N-acetylglucosamine synthase-like glycosyltransferase
LLCLTALKIAAAIAALRAPLPGPMPASDAIPPVVSIIVALYNEADIAPRLVRRLAQIDYPADLMDVILAVEAEDHITLDALADAELPPWMRVVVVPEGQVKTKPRALNHAFDHARGAIIGVYDAEDAPDPDQLHRVVERFQRSGPEVACLQGVLDYYNPRTNWLSRCFTIEYAGWFRLVLPGLARLGLVVPLGGTTLFFRREVLDRLGAWDAHNVTEDADLGMRLARMGYRCRTITSRTYEEATFHLGAWSKQRTRWLKGWMQTLLVHTRQPVRLVREMGLTGAAAFVTLLGGTLLSALVHPVSIGLVAWQAWSGDLPRPAMRLLRSRLAISCSAIRGRCCWCSSRRSGGGRGGSSPGLFSCRSIGC